MGCIFSHANPLPFDRYLKVLTRVTGYSRAFVVPLVLKALAAFRPGIFYEFRKPVLNSVISAFLERKKFIGWLDEWRKTVDMSEASIQSHPIFNKLQTNQFKFLDLKK